MSRAGGLLADSPISGPESAAWSAGDSRGQADSVPAGFRTAKPADPPDSCLPPVVEAVHDAVSGGKRLRPVFGACGRLAGGGDPESPAVARMGAALELFHAFALIHDDITDGSDAMHRALARLYPDQTDRRAAERFGVNAGDLCLVWSEELVHTAGLPPSRLRAIRTLLDAMRAEVTAGQYLDPVPRPQDDRLPVAWRTMALNTSGHTIERPLRIGATPAGDNPAMTGLRVAFQVRDDLPGVFGDPSVTGKSVTDDLREGKPTMLKALTWQRASAGQRRTISVLRDDLIRATGADAAVEELIRDGPDRPCRRCRRWTGSRCRAAPAGPHGPGHRGHFPGPAFPQHPRFT